MILIPAYEPSSVLPELITQLKLNIDEASLDCQIVVVNDGSNSDKAKQIFDSIKKQGIVILDHAFNQGKGAALKTGIRYALLRNKNYLVTADADGQHLPDDILKVLIKGKECANNVVLGVRTFDKGTPFRSRLGNSLTKKIFKLFYGNDIRDTQTGLRYIPSINFEELLTIPYNHYDFEFASLIKAVQNDNVLQIPIQTVYEPGNQSSHFNKFFDSARIYWVLARSIVVSTSTTAVDISIFTILQQCMEPTLPCIIISRLSATFLYILIARFFVFKSKSNFILQFFQYISLVLINSLIISLAIDYINSITGLSKILIYASLATPLYLINFYLQKRYIFHN